GVALLFLIPPIVWNVQHDWVTFKHVAKQTGAAGQRKILDGNFGEFVGSQLGVLGPALAVILGGAIAYAWRRQRALIAGAKSPSPLPSPTAEGTGRRMASVAALGEGVNTSREDRAVVLLLWMGLPLFVICMVGSIRSKMQVNWPAG